MYPVYYIVFGIVFVKIGFVDGGLINKEYFKHEEVISTERNEESTYFNYTNTPKYTNNKQYLLPDHQETVNYDVFVKTQSLRFKRSNFSLLDSLQTVPNKLYSKISESLKKNVNKAKVLAGIIQSAVQNKNENETCENKGNDMTNTCINTSPETNTTTTINNYDFEGNNTLANEKNENGQNDIVHNGVEMNVENNTVTNLNHTIQNNNTDNNKTSLINVNSVLPVNDNQTIIQESSQKDKHEGNCNNTVTEELKNHENGSMSQINIENTKESEEKICIKEKPNGKPEIYSVNISKAVDSDSELTRVLQEKVFFKDDDETLESLLKKTMQKEIDKKNLTSPTLNETINSIPPRINSEVYEKEETQIRNNETLSTQNSLLEENTEKYDLEDKNNFVNDVNKTPNTESYKNEENKSIETSTFPAEKNKNVTVDFSKPDFIDKSMSDNMNGLTNEINETIGSRNTFPQTHITFKDDEEMTTVSTYEKNTSSLQNLQLTNKEQNNDEDLDANNTIFLQSDTWNCTYSNLHLNIENRSMECNKTECIYENNTVNSSQWLCGDKKCILKNVDFKNEKSFDNKKIIQCSLDGRTLIKAPIKCAAGEQLINSKCRKVYGV